MTLETDLLIDRRRLKRRLFVWQIVAVLAVVAAILVGMGRTGLLPTGRHITRIDVSGLITEDPALNRRIDRLARNRSVAAVILSIDSPGGSVAGGESLHDAIARVARVKPVVAVMRGEAASAAYMIAVPAARIFARDATLTGSIGVLLETGEISGLLGKIGVATQTFVSGPLKDQPSFTHPTSPAGQQVMQGIVMELYRMFVGMVAEGRHMDVAKVEQLADGRPYTGQQALQLGLIDAIGGEPEARAWLASARGVPQSVPVRDLTRQGWMRDAAGSFLGGILKTVSLQGVTLDGAWAIWQPGRD
jgi:protease IV